MSMFDYVVVTCPHCGEIVEDQTKAYDCNLDTISLDEELPVHIACAFEGRWHCNECDKLFYVITEQPKMVKPIVVRNKPYGYTCDESQLGY